MKYPPPWHGAMWKESLPLGNGKTGGLLYGGVNKEIMMLTNHQLWWQYNTPEYGLPLPVCDMIVEMPAVKNCFIY